jgi:hypothetical protein
MTIKFSSIGGGGIPSGETADRPANPAIGDQFYNGTLGVLEIYTPSGWLAATGANDFNVTLEGSVTTANFTKEYFAGAYTIASALLDSTYDIYVYSTDGTQVGYTKTPSLTATGNFNKIVILGGTAGDLLSFSFKTTFTATETTSQTTAGPFITSVSSTSLPNVGSSITITGGNFASDVNVTFTGTGYSETNAKSITRNSESSLSVTRPDNLLVSGNPYTIKVYNPGVTNPTGSNLHVYTGITGGSAPVWSTSSVLPAFSKNVSYSTNLVATDSSDSGSTISYSVISGLPTGLSLSSSGALTGTISTSLPFTGFAVRATDSGGNYVDRTFSLPNAGPVWTTSGTINVFNSFATSVQLVAVDDTGTAPVYTIASGTLPTGLSMSSGGLITGTATSNGTSVLTFNATDANGTATTSSSISIIVSSFTSHEVLVVGAGASGSTYATSGGAGGGGGAVSTSTSAITANSTNITVGAGGAAISITANASSAGNNGNNSSFGSITANGGSGANNGVGGTSGNGNSGGAYQSCSGDNVGGGGGGSGASGGVGTCASPATGSYNGTGIAGAGGSGTSNSTGGSSVIYGGGGGGGAQSAGSQYTPTRGGAGGSGGGGYGGGDGNLSFGLSTIKAQSGTANTGGGGGGNCNPWNFLNQDAYGNSGAGGSGIVILAIANSYSGTPTISSGLVYSYSASQRSGYRVWTFTSGTGTFTV